MDAVVGGVVRNTGYNGGEETSSFGFVFVFFLGMEFVWIGSEGRGGFIRILGMYYRHVRRILIYGGHFKKNWCEACAIWSSLMLCIINQREDIHKEKSSSIPKILNDYEACTILVGVLQQSINCGPSHSAIYFQMAHDYILFTSWSNCEENLIERN